MCISEGRQAGSVLLNIALNTFYLQLYSVRHIVNDHSISELENQLFSISSKGSFIRTILHTG